MLETEEDKVIFHRLYKENRQKLYFIAWRILHNETYAEDAVHAGFLKLANTFGRYRQQPYVNLVKICSITVRNAAIDITRENEKKYNFWDENGKDGDNIADATPDILDELIAKQERSVVAEALMELEEEERELIYLQYTAGMKPKEIGKMLNMTSAAIRKKTFYSRNKLARILESKGYKRNE